jgi:hypothetical protein
MLLFVLFNKDCSKENMRKSLRASKPNPSLVSYLALILDYKLFKFGRFQSKEKRCKYATTKGKLNSDK